MKKICIIVAVAFSIMACNNESEGTGSNDSVGIKGNGDSASGGTITTVIDSSTSINQSTGALHDSVGAMRIDSLKKDSSK